MHWLRANALRSPFPDNGRRAGGMAGPHGFLTTRVLGAAGSGGSVPLVPLPLVAAEQQRRSPAIPTSVQNWRLLAARTCSLLPCRHRAIQHAAASACVVLFLIRHGVAAITFQPLGDSGYFVPRFIARAAVWTVRWTDSLRFNHAAGNTIERSAVCSGRLGQLRDIRFAARAATLRTATTLYCCPRVVRLTRRICSRTVAPPDTATTA